MSHIQHYRAYETGRYIMMAAKYKELVPDYIYEALLKVEVKSY